MTFLQIWVLRPARYLCPWRNPMARRTDRVESVIALTLLILLGLSFPLASWAAESVYHTVSAHARTQSASGRYTDATLLENVPAGGIGSVPWVKARWTAPDGTRRVELVPATTGTSAGSTQRIWIDRRGHRTQAPPDGATVTAEAVGTGVLVVLGAAFVLDVTRRAARRTLDRSRLVGWDAEWRDIGPRWTRPSR